MTQLWHVIKGGYESLPVTLREAVALAEANGGKVERWPPDPFWRRAFLWLWGAACLALTAAWVLFLFLVMLAVVARAVVGGAH